LTPLKIELYFFGEGTERVLASLFSQDSVKTVAPIMSLALVKAAAISLSKYIKKLDCYLCACATICPRDIYEGKGVQTSGDSRQSWSMAALDQRQREQESYSFDFVPLPLRFIILLNISNASWYSACKSVNRNTAFELVPYQKGTSSNNQNFF